MLANLLLSSYNVTTSDFKVTLIMGAAIRTRIIKIGNSQGIRIPKLLLEQSGIHAEVEIEVQGSHLTVRPFPQLRMGWNQAFATMAEQGDDILLDDISPSNWERDDWAWD